MQDAIVQFLTAHPNLQVYMTMILVLRTIFKPLMAVLESGVQASGNANALAILNKAEASKAYKALVFIVDYTTSLKLPVVQSVITNTGSPGK